MKSDLSRILEKGKSETTESKGARAPLDALAKAVCGMLNQSGGVLVWGVDGEGHIVGLTNAENRAKELNSFLMSNLKPRPLLSVSVLGVAKNRVVVVDIPMGADKPYSINREIWVRLGSKTLRAGDDVSTIVERSAAQLDRWERAPMPGFGMDDCDATELARARTEIMKAGRFGIDVPASDEELLRRLYLERGGQLTNAAVVLFALQPRAWDPSLSVRIVSYSQDRTGPIANDTVVEGPAVHVVKEVVGILQQRTGFSGRFEKGRLEREDRPAYAVFALREGLVNALVHRDYESTGGDVRIEIFPDRLTIRNQGRLPDGWSMEDLARRHGSHPGNPDIASVFYLRTLMEQLGVGTQKLIEACKELGAKDPIWRTERDTISLTLFRAPEPEATGQLADRQMRFLNTAKAGSEFKVGDYAHAANVSERQARRDLAKLETLRLVERYGKGPATSYRLTTRTSR